MFSAFLFISSAFSTTLPNGYTQLEYIESTGTQYIDTGFVYSNNTRMIWDIQMTTALPLSVSNSSSVGYINNNYERFGFSIAASNQKINFFKAYSATSNPAGDTILRTTVDADNNRHVLEINSPINKAYVDGAEYTFDSAVGDINNDHNLTLPLFAWWENTGYRQYFTGRAYSVKIYDNGIIVRNLIPAKRNTDGEIGMYDTVNNVFYANSGTGSFIAGPVVSYTELEYIELQGEAYFNTNVYLSKDMDIEFEFMPTQLTGSYSYPLATCRSVNSGGFINSITYTNTVIDFFRSGSSDNDNRWIIKQNGSNYILGTNKKCKLSIINKIGSFYVDGTLIENKTYTAPGTSPMTLPLYINASNFSGDSEVTPVGNAGLNIRFYHFSASGVADIVPVRRNSDGVLGLYNKTTGEFLPKIGSGTLVAGPEVGVIGDTCTYATIMGENICLIDTQPSGSYLPVKYNNNKYYLMLDATHDYPIHKNSDNKLKVIVGNTTYNAHDVSVLY